MDSYTFSGSAGDVILIRMAETTADIEPRLRLLNPSGIEIEDIYSYDVAIIDQFTLPVTGTYTITASDYYDDETGDYCLHLQCLDDPADAVALLPGQSQALALPMAAACQAFTMEGAAGDRLFLRLVQDDSTVFPQVRVYDPDGTEIAMSTGSIIAEVKSLILSDSGTYTVLAMDHPGTDGGTMRLYSQLVNDPVGASSLAFGQTLLGTAAQRASGITYQFTATVGDHILLRLAEITSELEPELNLYDPAGDLLTSIYSYDVAEFDALVLSTTGTYTIVATDYYGDEVGDMVIHLQKTSNPAGPTILTHGQTVAGTLTQPAETRAFTIAADAGDHLLVRLVQDDSTMFPHYHIYNPDGTLLSDAYGSTIAEETELAITSSGVHTILVMDHPGTDAGAFRLHTQCINDPVSATSIGFDQTLITPIDALSLSRAFRFTAGNGDRVILRLAELDPDLEPQLLLYDPSGELVASTYSYDVALHDAVALSMSGTYTILAMDYYGDETGSMALHLQRTNNPTAEVPLTYGSTESGALTQPASTDAFTIEGNAGDQILIRLAQGDGDLFPHIRFYRPDGQFIDGAFGSTFAEHHSASLPVSGTFTILVMDHPGGDIGAYHIHVQRLNDPVSAITIEAGETHTGSLVDLADAHAYRFTGTAGQRVLLRMAETTSEIEPRLTLHDAEGTELTGLYSYDVAMINAFELPDTGPYTIMASDYYGDEIGTYALHLQRTANPADPVPLAFGQTEPGSLSQPSDTRAYTFEAEADDRVLLRMGGQGASFSCQIRLYGPEGLELAIVTGSTIADMDAVPLTATGTHTVLAMNHPGTQTGDFMLHLQRTNNPGLAHPMNYFQVRDDELTAVAQTVAYTFSGAAADSVFMTMTELISDLEPELRLYDPDGVRLAQSYSYDEVLIGHRLDAAGTYTVLAMDYYGEDLGPYRFFLNAVATAVPDIPDGPQQFAFYGNHPNPFNPLTTIVFDLPEQRNVELQIVGIDGRRVCTLISEQLPAGRHSLNWDGRNEAGQGVASGTYIGVLKAGSDREAWRLTLVR